MFLYYYYFLQLIKLNRFFILYNKSNGCIVIKFLFSDNTNIDTLKIDNKNYILNYLIIFMKMLFIVLNILKKCLKEFNKILIIFPVR